MSEHQPQRTTRSGQGTRPSSVQPDEAAELRGLAEETARGARAFLASVTEVASGASPEVALPLLLLALSDILGAGARLGAMQDILPADRYEEDSGPEGDAEPLRDGLANLLGELDEYACVEDPLRAGEPVTGSVASDVADIALALSHGLRHHEEGRVEEALWWWQFSFLASWGDQANLSLRAVLSILSHVRLDADEELVGEAEFDALHP